MTSPNHPMLVGLDPASTGAMGAQRTQRAQVGQGGPEREREMGGPNGGSKMHVCCFLQYFNNLNHMFAHIYNTLSTKIAPSWSQMASK